ncbi:FtsX-like permease family protein [Vagococcus sp. BWB3-3]|uniref:FtsX-like permease family protein n=1 Tax=Vagococcus allomyrinae TaxID=2794353 RepID=A0A940PF52_9ENTE|nr:FtsX-like permease family protein [Vagococcus allomyrinae]MBP1042843.1 FtsX-like permease family protein [Vagococcus allomyrinae]
MKKNIYLRTLFKDIMAGKGRFFAIILIIFLGILLFVGIKSAGPSRLAIANHYLDQTALSDTQVVSTGGLTSEDAKIAEKLPGVTAQLGYRFPYIHDSKHIIDVFSYDKNSDQNQLTLTAGRLPEADDEIVLDSLAKTYGVTLNQDYTIAEPDLATKDYRVVGFVDSPLFIDNEERGITNIGDGSISYFAYVPLANFTSDIYSIMYLSFDNVTGVDRFETSYEKKMETNQDNLDKLFKERPTARKKELATMALEKLAPEKAKLADGLNQLTEAKQQLALVEQMGSSPELTAQQATLATKEQELNQGAAELAAAEEEIKSLSTPSYYFNGIEANPGLQGYASLADRIDAIGNIFPVFFIFIAMLITFTTMTRMVEEKRKEIGTLKALGYSKMEISAKYLIYATLAAFIGCFLGVIVGTYGIPYLLFEITSDQFIFKELIIQFYWLPISLAITASLIATLGSAIVVLTKDLRERPAFLMQPKSPKSGKRILLEYLTPLWSRLSFNQKVSYRNLFRFKSRMILAIIGIAGCTGLMMAGFGIKNSIDGTVTKQFGPITHYDGIITLDEGVTVADSAVATVLDQKAKMTHLAIFNETVTFKQKGISNQTASLFVPTEPSVFKDYLTLKDGSGNTITLADKGAVITDKLARLLNVKIGDTIEMTDGNNQIRQLKISQIADNYVGHFIYLTPRYYEDVFDRNFLANTYLFKADLNQHQENQLAETLNKTDDVVNVTFLSDQISSQKSLTKNLGPVIVIFVVLSGLLAFVVLYNLTNINISERVRELSTLKVLGFYNNEVTMYIVRENLIFTLIGIICGFGIGNLLTTFIIRTAEMDNLVFPIIIGKDGYLFSSILTMVFSIIVLLFTHVKLKHIDMIDSLKSNE